MSAIPAHQRERRRILKYFGLCISGWSHGASMSTQGKSANRCPRCVLVHNLGAKHAEVAAYDASEAGQRWRSAKLELEAMAARGELGSRLPGRRTPLVPGRHPKARGPEPIQET